MSLLTMRRVFGDSHQVKLHKISRRQLLSVATKNEGHDRTNLLLRRLLDHTQPTVLWTDEKLFTVQVIDSSQNFQNWTIYKDSVPFELRISFRRQKPASVMVYPRVTSSELKALLAFVEDGVKTNQHVYLNMLKDKVVPWMKDLILNNGLTLQQDDSTAPFTAFWLKEMWPPSSPDLNLMDFRICFLLEQKARIVSQPSFEEIINRFMGPNESESVRATCVQVI